MIDIILNAEKDDAVPDSCVTLHSQGDFHLNLLCCLGLTGEHPPVADLLRRYHGLEGEWLVASPMYWQATHNDALILACGKELKLTDEDSRRWFGAFRDFMASDTIQTYYHDAYTWLLRCDGKPMLTSPPIHAMINRSLMAAVRSLDETLYWTHMMTENQMFFSQHVLNKTREGLYPLNGVWLWGSGVLGPRVKIPVVCYDEPLAALARLVATEVVVDSMPSSFSKTCIFLCPSLDHQSLEQLAKPLKKHTVRWYWNNIAYQTSPPHWLLRFIERIF